MQRDSRKLLALLRDDRWTEVSHHGSHVTLKHPTNPLLITVPHPKKDLPAGLVRRIYRDAGWRT